MVEESHLKGSYERSGFSWNKLFHVFKNYWNNIMIYAAVNNIC